MLNPHTFLLKPHPRYNLPVCIIYRVQFVNPDGSFQGVWDDEDWWIVPKNRIPDYKAGQLLAARECAKRLNHDAMTALIPYMGAKVKYYDQVVGPDSFEVPNPPLYPSDCYRVAEPIAVSIEGILELLEKGKMEIARLDRESYQWRFYALHSDTCFCENCKKTRQIVALTPDAFRHIFPDGRPMYLAGKYGTVEAMLRMRECYIKKLKLAARGDFS